MQTLQQRQQEPGRGKMLGAAVGTEPLNPTAMRVLTNSCFLNHYYLEEFQILMPF